jgi:peptidoglycan/LPS O-acetylase OafA/YrhL
MHKLKGPKEFGSISIYTEFPLLHECAKLSFLNIGGNNHLWTIPIEINYYFFIPFICMIYLCLYRASKKLFYALLIACLGLSVYHFDHDLFSKFPRNPFVVNLNDFRAPWFATFLCGSLLAFTYLTLDNGVLHFNLCKWIISTRVAQLLLNLTTGALIVYAFRSEYLSDNEGAQWARIFQNPYKTQIFFSRVPVLISNSGIYKISKI